MSKIITHLIKKEIEKRERALYECALCLQQDIALQEEMAAWDTTMSDGLQDKN